MDKLYTNKINKWLKSEKLDYFQYFQYMLLV